VTYPPAMEATPTPPPAVYDSAAPRTDADEAVLAAAGHLDDDLDAPYDLEGLSERSGATMVLLEAIGRAGFLLPHHVDADGIARYSEADVRAVAAGLDLLDAGLPLAELIELARHTDNAVGRIAEQAVDAFLRFVRDPVLGATGDEDAASAQLVTASTRMLPSTERLVAHHLRRRIIAAAIERLQAAQQPGTQG
jgi:DNA-binding transcriptional MerR regulator